MGSVPQHTLNRTTQATWQDTPQDLLPLPHGTSQLSYVVTLRSSQFCIYFGAVLSSIVILRTTNEAGQRRAVFSDHCPDVGDSLV